MVGPSKTRNKKRTFHGNRYSVAKKLETETLEDSTSSTSKLRNSVVNVEDDVIINEVSGCRIKDLKILISVFSILCCPVCFKNQLQLVEDSRFGLCSNFTLRCENCSFAKGFSSSEKSKTNNEVNTRFIYALRLIGEGFTAGKKICATMNLPPFLSKLSFRQQKKKLLGAKSVAKLCMEAAASEITVPTNLSGQ